jgi:4-amino-4-deoxy-L-arabinose transferase-like glycosyltransferase
VADPAERPGRIARPELLIIVGGAVLAGIAMLWNIARSPDTQYDEVVYTRAAQQVAQGWHLTWTNSPMFVHPPLSFLTQAFWLRLLGLGSAPLEEAIVAARVLTAGMIVFAILLLGLLAAYLMPAAGRRRGLLLVALVVVLAATDPVLLRYGRLALIEPFALVAALLTLFLAIRLHTGRALVYLPVVGLATGLTLLTKEVTAFLVFTPVVHALLGRERRRVLITGGAFVWGLGLWLLFPLWAVALGLTTDFVDVKFATFQRLLGLLQITGWNRPGVSLVDGIVAQLAQYATSFVFLLGGALALLWLMTKAVTGASRWLLAWLVTSYAFAAYMVLLGTLNEQFFVYILPASIVGTVLMGDALLARRGRRSGGSAGALGLIGLTVAVLGFGLVGWGRLYATDNGGVFAVAQRVRDTMPACATLTVTGDPDKYGYLLPGRTVASFATGEGAQSHGVHLFVLSDKDVASGYGNATTELTAWVRARGTLVESFPSVTYQGLQMWEVPVDPYDPLADVETIPGGSFMVTDVYRCGGFPVVDGAGGDFATAWTSAGGKAVLGAPLTSSWSAAGASYQAFTGAVLAIPAGGRASALPVVQTFSSVEARAYTDAGLPPVTTPLGAPQPDDGKVSARLTDPAIAAAYLQGGPVAAARERLGDPVGPVTTMPDGVVRQAFAGGVLEHPEGSDRARLAPLAQLLLDTGAVKPDAQASTVVAAPPLASELGPGRPTTVQPFVTSLLAGLALYTAIPVLLTEAARMARGRRRPPPPPQPERPREKVGSA